MWDYMKFNITKSLGYNNFSVHLSAFWWKRERIADMTDMAKRWKASDLHCVKNGRFRSCSGPNAGKYRLEYSESDAFYAVRTHIPFRTRNQYFAYHTNYLIIISEDVWSIFLGMDMFADWMGSGLVVSKLYIDPVDDRIMRQIILFGVLYSTDLLEYFSTKFPLRLVPAVSRLPVCLHI